MNPSLEPRSVTLRPDQGIRATNAVVNSDDQHTAGQAVGQATDFFGERLSGGFVPRRDDLVGSAAIPCAQLLLEVDLLSLGIAGASS
jgi:hypothetical protein